MPARIERLITSGTFSLDGGTWDVDNNVWLVGDDDQVLIIDAAHSAERIIEAVGDREVVALVCTHGHNDHINAVGAVRDALKCPVWISSADSMLWEVLYDEAPDHDLTDGTTFEVADSVLRAIHTPGHSPGSTSLYSEDLEAVFTGDTLFQGGPGATGRSYSDHPTILRSIRERLLTLPPGTVVHTGHGDTTTIAAESLTIL
ncbi:MBL fold metallo-hydrolase [Kribbella sp. NPDC023855]|uniref:MBL fold metallo-hydrolase n=1 Tax=Kribbella sp. NPDC023855 TaxID=3154698 RepID=UPI0033D410B8